MIPTQFDIIDDLTTDHLDASIWALETLTSENTLDSQMRSLSGEGNNYNSVKDFDTFSYFNKNTNTYFVLSDADIEEDVLVAHIKKNVGGVEPSASVSNITSDTSLNYLVRDNFIETEFNNKAVKVYLSSKSNPSDTQKVSFIKAKINKIERKNKNKNSI